MSTKTQKTKSGILNMPAFFPDATHAILRGVGIDDLENIEIDGLVVNTYHLLNTNMLPIIEQFGGIHGFLKFNKPVVTDSGGFQVMSLIRENPKNGKITEDEIIFKLENSSEKLVLTPENCIQTQIRLGSDILMCLDDCTNPTESLLEQEKSVTRTINWAKRCKAEFDRLTANVADGNKPLIFGIIQGGNSKELRKKCADALISIGFDGFAYGGWPVDGDNNFMDEIVEYVGKLTPDDKPKYAMGVGMPQDIIKCVGYGYTMFDCVLPTRDARHKRLYAFISETGTEYEFKYLGSGKHKLDSGPVSKYCDCVTCTKHSIGYLYHLFKLKDALSVRLSTIHNLRFYAVLMQKLRNERD